VEFYINLDSCANSLDFSILGRQRSQGGPALCIRQRLSLGCPFADCGQQAAPANEHHILEKHSQVEWIEVEIQAMEGWPQAPMPLHLGPPLLFDSL
jgi:hypothetical protein